MSVTHDYVEQPSVSAVGRDLCQHLYLGVSFSP